MSGCDVTELDTEALGELAVADLDAVPSDVHGSSDHRRRIGAVVVARALGSALQEAARA
jgi:carbon-monoxide dehydrogenase medium subunit